MEQERTGVDSLLPKEVCDALDESANLTPAIEKAQKELNVLMSRKAVLMKIVKDWSDKNIISDPNEHK